MPRLGLALKSVYSEPGSAGRVAGFTNNYSLAFDGTNDYIAFDDIAELDGVAVFSMSTWFKSSSSGGDQAIFSKGNPDGDNDGIDIFYDSEEIYIDMQTDAGNFRANTTGNAFAADSTWYHLAIVYNGSTILIYKDASVVKTATSITGTTVDSSKVLWVGRRHATTSKYFTGNIDDMAFWDAALSAADVTAIYNSGVPIDLTSAGSYDTDRTGDLQGYWKFEEGSGTSATDSSDGGNDGTITNGAAYDDSVTA